MNRFRLKIVTLVFLLFSLCLTSCGNAEPVSAVSEKLQKEAGFIELLNNMDRLPSCFTMDMSPSAFYYKTGSNGMSSIDFPDKFDLRDFDVVPEVRHQGLWGTCWGFATTAASEISMLYEMGLTADEFRKEYGRSMDLSEKHLAWFANSAINENSAVPAQDGEGMHLYNGTGETNEIYDFGGFSIYASTAYSAGMGPVNEEAAPYVNSAGEKSTDGDWSLPEEDRLLNNYELENSNILPDPSTVDMDGNYVYNEIGTLAIKSELLAGRAVSITYNTGDDSAFPYTGDPSVCVNHAATVIGWDDSFPAECFGKGGPAENGAWIVRNSWGKNWGEAGYFYLSYYDSSISSPQSFDFFTTPYTVETIDINAYDYMPVFACNTSLTQEPVLFANIFEMTENCVMEYVSCMTGEFSTEVTFDIYLLDGEAETPAEGKLIDSVTETFDFAGYHRVPLTVNLHFDEGDRVSVVISEKIQDYDGKQMYVFVNGVNNSEKTIREIMGDDGKDSATYAVGVINRGESFVSFGEDNWYDWLDVVNEFKTTDGSSASLEYDNFSIKTYSRPYDAVLLCHDIEEHEKENGTVEFICKDCGYVMQDAD